MTFRRRITIILIAFCGFFVLSEYLQTAGLDDDEKVVFFTTPGMLDSARREWVLPIHAWVFEPADSVVRKAAIAQVLKSKYGLEATPLTQKNFDRRVNLFLVDNEGGERLRIRIGDRLFGLPKTLSDGHVRSVIRLPESEAKTLAKDGLLPFEMSKSERETRTFRGQIQLIEPEGVSVISDIDDTVKVSSVLDKKRLFDNTFFQDFRAAPGMAELYRAWAKEGVAFHFVSSSPWHLYEPLVEFFAKERFPPASLHLKQVRLKDSSLLNLFKKGTETKPASIRPLLRAFPKRRFILVGDSGEQDPEVYAAIYKDHPDRILQVLIRNVTKAKSDDARFSKVFAHIPKDRWVLFDDPSKLAVPLKRQLSK
ncbi:MAG: phosphatase domain-containing protein [Planctomycetota bacterium]